MKSFLALIALAATAAFAQTYVIKPTGADPVACAAAASAAGGMCLVPYVPPVVVPPPPPVPVGVSITALGAKCDGKTDDSAAIAAAIASAKAKGVPALIPAATCAYAAVINLDGAKMQGQGDASVLYALDTNKEAIFLRGSGAELRSLKLSGVKGTTRVAPWEAARVVPFGATKFVIDSVWIDGGTAAGIQLAQAANNGTISNNRVIGTLSDSIHITGGASFITVTGNIVQASGDDGIAVVSYVNDGAMSHDVTARGNTVSGNKNGRGMSVVGGQNVLYENNRISNSGLYACIYLAQENGWATYADNNVTVRNNTLTNCGSTSTGHGAVLLYSDGTYSHTGVTVQRNDIVQQGQNGIRAYGPGTRIVFDSNRIAGANPDYAISMPGAAVTPYVSGAVGAP